MLPTKEVFDRYFADLDESTAKKIRASVDRPEVYEYEKKLGKSIFEMEPEELFQMLMTFQKYSGKKQSQIGFSGNFMYQAVIRFRQIWMYYDENIGRMPRSCPWNNKIFKRSNFFNRISQEKFTSGDFQRIKDSIKNKYGEMETVLEELRYHYYFCVINLLYDGCSIDDIVSLKPDNLSVPDMKIHFRDRIISLRKQTFDDLIFLQNHDVYTGSERSNFIPWNGSLFKYIIARSLLEEFDLRSKQYCMKNIQRNVIDPIRDLSGVNVHDDTILYYGFFRYLIDKYGDVKTKDLVYALHDSGSITELENSVMERGFPMTNIHELRAKLKLFI